MESDSIKLERLGKQWLDMIKDIELLWEIPLTQEEIKRYLSIIKRTFSKLHNSFELRLAFTIVAVNWAYYQKDDDGLREPFTEDLLGNIDLALWNDYLGPLIENTICSAFKTTQRSGPYRFVGLLRQHAGLPYNRTQLFISLLKELHAQQGGWQGVGTLKTEKIKEIINSIFPNSSYASEFLSTNTGIDLIRTVCRRLTNYEDGVLTEDEIKNLPGYRPDFLLNIIHKLKEVDIDVDINRRTPKKKYTWTPPELIVEPSNGLLRLVFYNLTNTSTVFCEEARGTLNKNTLKVGLDVPFCDKYSGLVDINSSHHSWEVAGWRPKIDNWALFSSNGRFLGHKGEGITVGNENYYFVVDDGCHFEEFGLHVLVEYGCLDLYKYEIGTTYSIYEVVFNENTNIDGIHFDACSRAKPKFTILDGQAWASYSSIDAVFIPTRTKIRINDWDQYNRRRYLALCEINGHTQRLKIHDTDLNTGYIDTNGLACPSTGRIWLEHVANTSIADCVAFANWPQCTFDIPQRLYQDSDKVKITIRSSCEIEIAFDNGIYSHEQVGSEWNYIVESRVSCLSGIMTYNDCSIKLGLFK